MTKYIPIYAHRGASGYAFENTFEAFEKARKLKADGIELDVQLSEDSVCFVFHDISLRRLTGVRKLINECKADEIKGYRIGRRFLRRWTGKRIRTLEEVLDWAIQHNMPLNLELKESLLDDVMPFIQLLKKYKLPEGSHVSSFHDELLRTVKLYYPNMETAIIVTKKFEWDRLNDMSYINAVHAHKRYYKQQFLKACEVAHKPMRFYSIDGAERFLVSPHAIVVGWITDYPDRIVNIQKRGIKSR